MVAVGVGVVVAVVVGVGVAVGVGVVVAVVVGVGVAVAVVVAVVVAVGVVVGVAVGVVVGVGVGVAVNLRNDLMTTSSWIIASSILSAIGAYVVGFLLGCATRRQKRDALGAGLDSACDEMQSVLAHHASDLSPMVRLSLRITIEDAERTLAIAGIRKRKES